MNGIPPRVSPLTMQQMTTSAEVAHAVPALPTALADLISQLAVPDFSLATQPVALSSDGRVVLSPENLEIIAMIELALNAPSSECSPAIKAKIFDNALLHTQYFGKVMQSYLGRILDAMKDRQMQVILDDVELTGFDMSQAFSFDLGGMSAQRAIFKDMILDHLKMDGADFTGAQFITTSLQQTNISKADITGATFTNVLFMKTQASELQGNQSGIVKSSRTYRATQIVDDVDVELNDVELNAANLDAGPDIENFILAAKHIYGPVSEDTDMPELRISLSGSFGFSIT